MFIFNDSINGPIIFESPRGMKALYKRLTEFLMSDDPVIELLAEAPVSPEPYEDNQVLRGLRVIKAQGPIMLRIDENNGLELSGLSENLKIYISYFEFDADEDGEHHHPEYVLNEDGEPQKDYLTPGALSLVIEVDSDSVEYFRHGAQ